MKKYRAYWHQLDICCKILEQPTGFPDTTAKERATMRGHLARALIISRDKNWSAEYDPVTKTEKAPT